MCVCTKCVFRRGIMCLLQNLSGPSVETDSMEERPVAFVLKLLQQLINFILHVVCVLDLKSQDTFHTAHEQK